MDLHLIPALAITLSEDILFFLVFGVFALIKFIASRNKAKEEAAPPESDSEQVRRTREIQEEIRRRIAENGKNAPAPTGPVHHVPPTPSVLHQEQVQKPAASRVKPPAPPAVDIWQQLAAAQRMEEETRRKAAEIRALRAAHRNDEAPLTAPVTQIEHLLHNPGGIRDAIILSELLSAPLSEREEGACPGLR